MRKLLFFIFIISVQTFGQNYYMERAQVLRSGNYLNYLNFIEENLKTHESVQSLGDAYSMVGDYFQALKIYNSDEHIIEHILEEKTVFDTYDYSEYVEIGIDSLLLEIQKVDFLLINEGHHRNYHRIFLRDHLEELFEMGFRNLFVEAVINSDSLNQRKYPLINSLTYPEPVFGELIRTALSLGFKVYSYDSVGSFPNFDNPNDEWNFRENIQYENIIKQYDGKKSIVFGGYDHIITNDIYPNLTFLGVLLKKDHKVLSIDQTVYVEENLREIEKAFYADHASVKNEIFFKNDSKSAYDYTLIHPRTGFIDGKPNWLISNKKSGKLKWDDFKVESPILVQVYKLDEYNKDGNSCIPVYQYIEKFSPDSELLYYYYEEEKEILVIKNSNDRILYKSIIR